MKHKSPLRYPGGKAKVAPFVKSLIMQNNLNGGSYIEPYVGGGAVAISLLFEGIVNDIYINDKDKSIFAFWYSILFETEMFCKKLRDAEITIDNWYEQREIQRHKETANIFDLGFSTFFLNRTNRSGILSGGVIGGLSQNGEYKMNARFNKAELIARIESIAQFNKHIHVTNLDAIDFLTMTIPTLTKRPMLIYLDPPYFVKGKGLYMNHYSSEDHKKIAENIKELGENIPWIMSYDKVAFIEDLYRNFRITPFELIYSASNSGRGKEIMIFSNNIEVPTSKIVEYNSSCK